MSGIPAGTKRGELAGRPILLLPEKAALYEGALLAADLHLGKESSCRRLGIPVPEGGTQETLDRLGRLCRLHRPREVVLLGDLWHSEGDLTDSFCLRIASWREGLPPCAMKWVRGNHDRGRRDMSPCFGEELAPGTLWNGIELHHEPPEDPRHPWAAGHIHPRLRVAAGGDSLSLPCFWQKEGGLVLPAFGEFTGGVVVEPGSKDAAWVVGTSSVFGPIAFRR